MATVAPAPAERDLGSDILIERRPFLERSFDFWQWRIQ